MSALQAACSVWIAAVMSLACASAAPIAGDSATAPATPRPSEQNPAELIPAGYGSLRQDDISLRVEQAGVLVKAMPLDESVIRVLAPDSYRTLHDLVESQRAAIIGLASRTGATGYSVWYLSFLGLQPDVRFSPMEVIIDASGREFRPFQIIPLTAGFGQQRLQQRQTHAALFLFDAQLDINQPLVFSIGATRNGEWATILRTIERERALARSRARPPP